MPKLADYAGRLAEIPFDFHEMIGTKPVTVRGRPFEQAGAVDLNCPPQGVTYLLTGREDKILIH
jgi:hypothetical protein